MKLFILHTVSLFSIFVLSGSKLYFSSDELCSFCCFYLPELRGLTKVAYVYALCCVLSHVWLFVTPWTVAHQAPLSTEFSSLEYWKGLPFSIPGDLPDPGIKPIFSCISCIGRRILYHWHHLESPIKDMELAKTWFWFFPNILWKNTNVLASPICGP